MKIAWPRRPTYLALVIGTIAALVSGCSDSSNPAAPGPSLSNWVRHPNNPIFGGQWFLSDPHVWEESPGNYRMVYTDANGDYQAIAMATSTDLVNWTPVSNSQYPYGVILQGPGPGGQDPHLETAFYRKANDGMHQIFYIGYMDEAAYHSAIYKAEATNIQGPYTREIDPVIPWTPGGPDSWAMTSPSIVEHDGALYMVYTGWEAYPDGPVTNMGATSSTDGRSWVKLGALSWDDVFGVEAHTEKGPDGRFYRVGITSDDQGGDIIELGHATHPFGPYTTLPDPILAPGGPGVEEGDTIMAPCLLFVNQTAYLYYTAIDTGGWPWALSLATSQLP